MIQQRFQFLLVADAIVPVPNHIDDPKRQLKAVGIAEELGRLFVGNQINIPVLQCLRKVKDIKTRRLNRPERAQAVEGMFEFEGTSLSGKKIILIDDMLTAGNVKGKCTDILKQNGAEKVWIFAAGGNR